ncbi:MAG TPA: ATP synthase F0 subunit B [Candidatus Baltobacteraceae bacterium]|jgi:F-type H+-transporting ATPase subunit b
MNDAQLYVSIALWSQVVAAILFIAFLVWLWVKYLMPAVLAAQERQNKQIAEAERHRDEAKATLDLLRNQISGAERDAEAIKQRAVAHAKREYDANVAEAKEAGERALANAQGELARARASARDQLRREILDRALSQARQDAERRVDAPTNARLVSEFLGSLERV